MPGPALHLLLAGEILARRRAAPLGGPARNAFLHGALGPDMGYFPGADRRLADLAHHARTGAFCRALLAEARDEVQAAFAWGWVTHVLADVAIHPLINEACGELLTGARTPLWGSAVAGAHLRVEMGLDAAYHPRLGGAPLLRPMAPSAFASLLRAYRSTFGIAPSLATLVSAHGRVNRFLPALGWWRAAAHRAASEPRGVRGGGAAALLGLLGASARPGSQTRALFTPVCPFAWLAHEVEEVVDGFGDRFETHRASRLRFLRDHCLDTGSVQAEEPSCARDAIAALLGRRRARGLPRAA